MRFEPVTEAAEHIKNIDPCQDPGEHHQSAAAKNAPAFDGEMKVFPLGPST
jgi:hypothetical protein